MHDITSYLAFASQLARDAGRYALNVQKSEMQVLTKSNMFDLVTDVDKQNEELIRNAVLARYPEHSFLGEESGTHGDGEVKWIVDPIDGTVNFAHGLPIWCVSIGVEIGGSLACGVIYDPGRDELFSAAKGGGAYLNGKQLAVSSTAEPSRALFVTGFSYNIAENPDKSYERFVAFLKRGLLVRRLGSAALDLAYVAAGRFDGFYEGNLKAWDMAAGALILTEAGGKLSQYEGREYSIYGKSIVATNGVLHDFMLEILAL